MGDVPPSLPLISTLIARGNDGARDKARESLGAAAPMRASTMHAIAARMVILLEQRNLFSRIRYSAMWQSDDVLLRDGKN